MTTKIYYEYPYPTEFDASIVQINEKFGKHHILLDQTAFYPCQRTTSCEIGTLDGIPIEQVYENDGDIFHVLSRFPLSLTVHCTIDSQIRTEFILHQNENCENAIKNTMFFHEASYSPLRRKTL